MGAQYFFSIGLNNYLWEIFCRGVEGDFGGTKSRSYPGLQWLKKGVRYGWSASCNTPPPPFFGGMNIFGGMWGGGGSALGNILDVGADRGQPITLLWTL